MILILITGLNYFEGEYMMTNYIINKLTELKKEDIVSFHVPGHKSGKIYDRLGYREILENIYTLDTTEIEGTDNLHSPQEIIKLSQDRASKVFKSDRSIYLVNGTTCGIQASIMSVCKPKSKIIVNRDCHQSVINACILGDVTPIYVKSHVCKETNILKGVTPDSVKEVIDNNLDAKAIILTYPTYYGKTYDLKDICDYAHSKEMVVIVDEAHGAHLDLSDILPSYAINLVSDIVIQSTHKTLPSFTQSSMIHIKGNRVDYKKLMSILKIIESSSPSYLLISSLELAIDIYENHGKELMIEILSYIDSLKLKFKNIKGIRIHNDMDETKLFISLKELGINGYELDDILRNKYRIQAELCNHYGVLLIATIGNSKEDFNRLETALKEIISKCESSDFIEETYYPSTIPEMRLTPREAFYKDKKRVKINDAVGKISGEYIIPYPPGISLISPGEIITQEIITYIHQGIKNGMIVSGIKDSNLEFIDIIEN